MFIRAFLVALTAIVFAAIFLPLFEYSFYILGIPISKIGILITIGVFGFCFAIVSEVTTNYMGDNKISDTYTHE